MKNQYISLLKKQIKKLENEDFDLEAWKTSAITVLHRIFGDNDPRAQQVENIRIDYSSWALRDSSSQYRPVETAKRKGKEILQTAVDEIEVFGAPEDHGIRVLGEGFVNKIQKMAESERKKHFEGLKKGELVELLMKLTN